MTAAAAFGQVLRCLVSARWRELRLTAEAGHRPAEGISKTNAYPLGDSGEVATARGTRASVFAE